MDYDFWVIVGHVDNPAETTCSAKDPWVALQLIGTFAKGGNMLLSSLEPAIGIYPPGTEVPDNIACHVVSPH